MSIMHVIPTYLPESKTPIEAEVYIGEDGIVELNEIWLYDDFTGSYDEPGGSYLKPWVYEELEQRLKSSVDWNNL